MKMNFQRLIKGVLVHTVPLLLVWFINEFLIYYLVLFGCNYPLLTPKPAANDDGPLRAMFLADTHLLGSRNGHWFDKLRREWQMHRAFQTAQTLFDPDLVVFLGDVFDEGKWCDPQEFDAYVKRFADLFYVRRETGVKIVAGNHDIGFHYAVTPYLNGRFEEAFETTSADLFHVKGVYFVTVNSMAMEGDGCFLCQSARDNLKKISERLKCFEDREACELDYDFGAKTASKPVLLQHFPLFRKSDITCSEPDEAPPEEKRKLFRPKFDCVSKESSEELLNLIKPRLVLSGHTHHGCRVEHKGGIPEYSVSSFSWRNRNNPAFLLATITPDDFAIEKCFLPEESTVINMYWIGGVAYVLFVIYRKRINKRRR